MCRIVVDTNVLVASAYRPAPAARWVIESCRRGDLTALVSSDIRREYERILARAVRSQVQRQQLFAWIDTAEVVEPAETPRVVPDDPDDDKLVAAALAGNAEYLITSDQHLLVLSPYSGVVICSAGDFRRRVEASS